MTQSRPQRSGLTRTIMAAMYVPAHFKPDDDEVQALLASGRAADLITATADGLLATMLPLVCDGPEARAGLGPWGALLGHVARNNAQWKMPAVGEAMVILAGPDAYISPGLVRDEARARPRGPDLELHHRRTCTAGSSSTTTRPGSRRTSAAERAPRGPASRSVVRRRRPRALHRGPAQGDRRRRDRHRPRRGQVEAQPEPLGRGHRGHDRGPRGDRRAAPSRPRCAGWATAAELTRLAAVLVARC